MISNKKKKKLLEKTLKGIDNYQKKNPAQNKTVTNEKGNLEYVDKNSNATNYKPVKIGNKVQYKPENIVNSLSDNASFENEKSYNNYVNDYKGTSFYGKNLSRSQVKSAINDLQSNPMAAVKDPDYSSKIKFLSDYSMNYGYKDKKYAKEYTKELENTIKELENDGYKNETSDPDNITFINKNKNKIDELKNKLSEFQKKVVAQDKINAEKNTIEIIKKNKDFSEKTKNVDYNKFFQGFDKAGTEYDRGFIGEAKDENKEAWYNYVAKDDRLKINAELYNVNINALDDDQKNTLVYLFKKIGDNNIDEAIKNGEVTTDGTEQGILAAEKELKAKDTRKLINFIKQIKNDEGFNARNESAQQQAIKDSSAANKVFSYAETFATKPLADTATTVGSVVQAITGDIDTESDFYKASNHIRKTRSGVSESVKENYGNTVGFVFDLGTNMADMVIQHALGGAISNGLKYANYGSEMKSAQKAFSYASKALLANSAYADSLISAKEKGLSDGQSIALSTIAGAAEVLTERFGLENLFEIFNKGLEKTTGKSVIKELSKQMFFEGSEEVASDIINTIADIAISKDESDFISSVNQYKEQGLSEGKAVAKTLKDTALDYGQDFLSGALMGLVMGGVGTVKNVKAYNSAVKSESLGVSKILLLDENQTEELISKAKEQGVKTEKFENEYKKLEAAAETAIDGTDESAEKYSEQFDITAAEFDKIRNKIKDKSGKKAKDTNDIFNQFFSKNNSVDVQADTSSVDNTNNSIEDVSDVDVVSDNAEDTRADIAVQDNQKTTRSNDNYSDVAVNFLKNNNRLAQIRQTAKSETAVNDLTEHIDDFNYKSVYNKLVNVEENSSATAQVGETPSVSGVSVEERSAEFNRIYDMGLDEENAPYEIKSDIFTPEQVRQIYAAAVIDDDVINNYGRNFRFDELVQQYEDQAALELFGNRTVKNIMTADKEQVIKTAQKFGLNVEFVNKVPGRNPNASGAYDSKTKTVYINQNTKYPIQQVFLHELTHFFESADGYSQFEKTVMNSKAFEAWVKRETEIKSQAYDSIDDYRKALKERYGEKDDTKINREIVAFFVSDNLFQKDFGKLGELAKEIGNNERKGFIAFIKKIFARLKTAVSGLDKLEKKFLNLSRSAGQNKNTDSNNGVKQMYAGEKSQTADKLKLETAKEMEKQGVDSETIRKETGWFKGYDNKWRFEIDDFNSKLIDNPNLEEHYSEGERYFTGLLSDVLEHNELFKSYPQLKDINIIIQPMNLGNFGSFFESSNDIVLNIELFKRHTKEYSDYLNGERQNEIKKIEQTAEYKEYSKFFDDPEFENIDPVVWLEEEKKAQEKFFNSELGKKYYQLKWGKVNIKEYEIGWSKEAKSVLMHEIQHAVQAIEGFARGANTDYWRSKISDVQNEYENAKEEFEKRYDGVVDVLYRFGFTDKDFENIDLTSENGMNEARKYLEKVEAPNGAVELVDNLREYARKRDVSFDELIKLKNRDINNLYSSTAGEIEATDVQNRLNLNNEQRKNTRPDIDRTDVVFSDSDRSYKINDYQFNESKLKNNADQVLKMNSVCDLVGDEFNGPLSTLNERIDNYFKKIGSVPSKDFGDIQLTKTSRRSDVRHGRTKYKISSYAAIPNVIENGTPVFVIFKNNVERVVIAAPITISSQKYYMGVMLQRDSQSQRLYLHDVVIEKEIEISTEEHLNTEQGRPRNDNLSMTSILKKSLNVNTNSRMILENLQNDTDIQQMYTGEEADSEYMSAVENGDTETAQRLVDEAAEKQFANSKIRDKNRKLRKVYHGTNEKFSEFNNEKISKRNVWGKAFYSSTSKSVAGDYGSNVLTGYLNIENPYINYKSDLGTAKEIKDKYFSDMWVSTDYLGIDYIQNKLDNSPLDLLQFIAEHNNKEVKDILADFGYDGVIDGSEIVFFNSKQFKSADAVTYDDNGNVIPLSERFNEDENDIRYMLDEDNFDENGDYFDIDEDGEVSYIKNEDYQKRLKKNPKLAVLDKQQIELKAKSILKNYQSRMDSADVASQLLAIYNDIKNIDENGNHAKPKVEKLANEIYDNIAENVSNGEVYDQLTEILKNDKMIWDESVKSAFGDDWNSFIRKNRHRLNLVKADSGKGGIGIDVMYDNLCRELPGYFDGEAKGAKAQLTEILDVLNSQQFVYDTFLDENKEEIIKQIIGDIYGGFAQIDYVKKGSDKAKAQKDYAFEKEYIDEYGIDEKRYKADMRKQINEKSADFVKEQKQRYKNGEISASQFADSLTEHFARVSLSAKIKPIESYYNASNKYRLRFEQINERTTKNLKELRAMLQNPTEGKYIPADLVDLVQDVLNIGDNQNFNLRDKLNRYRDTLSRADIDEGVLDVYKQAIDKCEDELKKQDLGKVFAEISRKYNSYKTGNAENTQAGEFEQSFYCYHEAVAKKLIQVAATLENADMTRLTMRQAEALDEGLNCLTHFVKNSVKAIGLTESAHVAEVGYDMIQETKATAIHKNFASKMLNTAINTELSPERMFRRLGGYAPDSMWVKMADMLTDGQTQAEFIKQKLRDVIAPVLDGENMKNADNARSYKENDLVDIGLVDENGESVKVPHAFMISAYLHLQNEANQNHALKGGFEIPDFRTYYKGKIANSFSEGKIKARFTDVKTAIQKLSQNMSEYDKFVAKNVASLFDKQTKAEYNKINMDVFGFEKAKVKNYFPIYSSNDFLASGFDTAFDTSLKNQGNMKSRIEGAVNPIKLMDVFDVVDKEISRCGEYCGKLKAEITMTRVYNTVTAEFGTSLKEQVGLHFGESGKKYIEHLMQDYSGTRKTENSVALSKLRGAVATSALMGNINVAMKQAGSYPTAAATIGWKPLLKALAVSDDGAKVFYRANRQLIDKYTPWLRYRTEGYSTQEIADLKNLSFYNKRQMKWLFGWINASDIATVGRLWQAAEYYIQDNNTELKKGTDEYYKAVAKTFNQIIFDTQPNYTVMQRPDILRNPNSLLKSMIMFSTQPLQNLGILYDSAMNYNAQRKAFKQGKVDKNVLSEAKRGLAKGISSVVVSGMVISLMTLLAKSLTGRMDDYLDEYGDLNAAGILKGSIGVFGSTMAGMVTFGSEVYNLITSAVTGDTYYGVNISSIDLVGDVFESFINEVTALKTQKDIFNKTLTFAEKMSALFGFPLRNIKNLFGGVINKFSTGEWFALNEKKKDSQYYAQMYDCCIDGDSEKYNKLYNELIERGVSVNEIESGIKKCLKEAEKDDINEAAEALNESDYKIYNDIINELVGRGFDESLVMSAIDEVASKLKGDELTEEQKKTKEKNKHIFLTDLMKNIDFSGLTNEQKAEAQKFAKAAANEYGYQAATGKADNEQYAKAIQNDKAGFIPIEDFIIGKTVTQKKYADTDGDGSVSAEEKYNAIENSNISADVKTLMQALNIMGSKKIDTDNDGKTDTAFDNMAPDEQKKYIENNKNDIFDILADKKTAAKKKSVKEEYRKTLESRIDVKEYKSKYREDVQKELDYFASAKADIEVSGKTDKKTAAAIISFDDSGFIKMEDYIKFYVYAKANNYTKNEEKLEVINQLDISSDAKLKLKLYTVASGWSLDSDGDGKRDKRLSTYSPQDQEKWIKANAGYIQSNCSYWR